MIWQSLKYFADENIDNPVTEFFQNSGYDFTNVHRQKLVSAKDREIIERAYQTDRIIITHDTDFGHIVFTEKISFIGIIYLQPGHIKSQFTIQSLQKLFSTEIDLTQPFMIVVEHKHNEIKIRVRNSIS